MFARKPYKINKKVNSQPEKRSIMGSRSISQHGKIRDNDEFASGPYDAADLFVYCTYSRCSPI